MCDSELIPLTSDDGQPVSPRKYFSITHLQVLEQCTTGMKYLHGECAISKLMWLPRFLAELLLR